jgi:hypothetical protein
MNETQYQGKLIKKLRNLFPGCVILKNDPTWIQGIPDILILFLNTWAMLEVKMNDDSSIQPNQEYYIDLLDEMSFASFIRPENEEEVLYALQQSFGLIR